MKESAYRAGAAGRPVTLVSASTGARGSAARASRARASRRPSFNTDGRTRATRDQAQRIKSDVQFPVFKIMFKMFILTNSIPELDGKESACYNRYKQLSFNSHFDRTGMRKKEDPEKLQFIADVTLGDRIKTEYVDEMMDLLIEYANKYYEDGIKHVPIQFQSDAKETKQSNDGLKTWLDDNCQLTGRLGLKQITFKMSEKDIKDGMKRLGFKYNKDLKGVGKDPSGKYYKGGYEGISLNEEIDEEVDGI